jgi:hypothetical protein
MGQEAHFGVCLALVALEGEGQVTQISEDRSVLGPGRNESERREDRFRRGIGKAGQAKGACGAQQYKTDKQGMASLQGSAPSANYKEDILSRDEVDR